VQQVEHLICRNVSRL